MIPTPYEIEPSPIDPGDLFQDQLLQIAYAGFPERRELDSLTEIPEVVANSTRLRFIARPLCTPQKMIWFAKLENKRTVKVNTLAQPANMCKIFAEL